MEMENPPCIRNFQKHIPLPPLKFGDDFSKDFTVLSFWGLLYSQTSYLLSTPGCCWCFNYVLHEQKRYWKWLLKSTAQMTFHQRNMAETGFGRWFRFHQQNNLDLSQTTRKWYPKIALMSPCNGNVNHHDEPRQCCQIWAPWDHMFHFAPVGFVENIYHTFPWSSCHGRDRPISVVRQQLYATKNLSHFGKNLGGSSNSSLITFWETIVIQPFLGYNIGN